MMREVSTTREGILKFLRQYKTLSDVETYQQGIDLLARANRQDNTTSGV